MNKFSPSTTLTVILIKTIIEKKRNKQTNKRNETKRNVREKQQLILIKIYYFNFYHFRRYIDNFRHLLVSTLHKVQDNR